MIQNDTNTSDQLTSERNGARTLVSRPAATHALGLLLALGLVAGCGDDGGAPNFPADAGADAAADSGGTSTDKSSSGVGTSTATSTGTSAPVSTTDVNPSSTVQETSEEVDSGTDESTDTSTGGDSTSSPDTTVTDVSGTDTGSSLT